MSKFTGKVLFILLLLASFSLKAQKTYKVAGTLMDENEETIPFATVGLFNASDSTAVQGTITNTVGAFEFRNILPGRFYIRVSHVSYALSITPFQLTTDTRLQPIVLKPQIQELDELVVTAERGAIQNDIDKITISPSQMLTGKGGNAIDVLRAVPIVQVSPEGGINIRGGGDIQILINGKPSGMVAVQGSQFLNQIDASAIERIEIITNPGAKYGADGGSGIINVILKKDKTQGLKGDVLVSIGNRDRYTLSPSISYRREKINFFLRYSRLQNTRRTDQFGDEVRNDTIAINQTSEGIFKDLRHNIEFGADYFFNERRYLTVSGLYRSRDKSSDANRFYRSFLNGVAEEERITRNSEPEKNEGYGITISYFDENKEETRKTEIVLDLVHSIEDETIARTDVIDVLTNGQTFAGGRSRYKDINDGVFLDISLERPLANGSWDLGGRYFYRNIDQQFSLRLLDTETGNISLDSLFDDVFAYNDHVVAAYSEITQDVGNFKFTGGLRLEYSINRYTTRSSIKTFENTFLNVFPSIMLGYRLSDVSTIQINYGRRINRPSPNRLNPFPGISAPFQIEIGNPNLKPEFIDSYNLGYQHEFDRAALGISLFYKKYHDLIQRVSTIDENGFRTIAPVNLSTLENYGFDLSYSADITDFWNMGGGLAFFRNDFDSPENNASNRGYIQQYKVNSNIKISNKLRAQVSGFYNSPEVNAQGKRLAQHYLDMALNYKLLDEKVELNLSITDLFNTLKEIDRIDIPTLQSYSEKKVDTRIIRFSISYEL